MKNMISENLRYLRNIENMSQEQFAEKLGVSRQTIAKWENGESLPDVERCAAIAYACGSTLDELVMCSMNESRQSKLESDNGKYVFGMAKVGERGQVVIHKHARDVYSIKPGDKILVLGDDRGMAFIKLNGFHKFFGK